MTIVDQTTVLVVRHNVEWCVTHPRRGKRRLAAGTTTAENATIGCGLPFSRMVKSAAVEPLDRMAILVEHGHVELDDVDAGAERRQLLIGGWRLGGRGHDGQHPRQCAEIATCGTR